MADTNDRAVRAPRRSPVHEALHEGRYQEILVRIESLDGRIGDLDGRFTSIAKDTREARDATIGMTARLGAQDLPARVGALKASIDAAIIQGRTDLVNSISRVTLEMREDHEKHEARIKDLETFKNNIEGAGGVFGWLATNAPWLVAIVMAGLAMLGFKGKLS